MNFLKELKYNFLEWIQQFFEPKLNKDNKPLPIVAPPEPISEVKPKQFIIEPRPIKHFSNYPLGAIVNTGVIHFISAIYTCPERPYDIDECFKILNQYMYSADFIIGRKGRILQLVDLDKKAWHAGCSIMPDPDNRKSINSFSIGIEMVGIYGKPFTEEQYEALNWLHINHLIKRYPVIKYVGHDQISGERAVILGIRKKNKMKIDPGPSWKWDKFNAIHFVGNPLRV